MILQATVRASRGPIVELRPSRWNELEQLLQVGVILEVMYVGRHILEKNNQLEN